MKLRILKSKAIKKTKLRYDLDAIQIRINLMSQLFGVFFNHITQIDAKQGR